jgi:hypothetical protein
MVQCSAVKLIEAVASASLGHRRGIVMYTIPHAQESVNGPPRELARARVTER